MLNNEMVRSNDSGSAAQPATTVAPSSSGARQASDKGVPPHQQLSRDQELRRTAREIVQAIFQNAKEKSSTAGDSAPGVGRLRDAVASTPAESCDISALAVW